MAEKLTIKFSATGDKALIASINALNAANVRLIKGEKEYIALQNKLQAETAKTSKGLFGLGHSARNTSGAFSSLRSQMLLAAFSFAVVVKPIKDIAKAASDNNEVLSKANIVFGRNMNVVKQWANALGNSVGRATSSIIAMASSLQDTFVPLGFSRAAATELSTSMTKLAIDVASFNNAADADVMKDFQSAIVGNHETVRKYGIVITESSLKQEALTLGLTKTIRELTNQEKVQARLSLITKGSADAVGDAARTSEEYANAVKALSDEWKEVAEEIGERIMPIIKILLRQLDPDSMQAYAASVTVVTGAYIAWGVAAMGVSKATKILKANLVKLGIPALIIGLGYLIDKMGIFHDEVEENNDALDEAKKLMEQNAIAAGKLTSSLSSQELVYERILKLIQKTKEEKIKQAEADLIQAQAALISTDQQIVALLQASGAFQTGGQVAGKYSLELENLVTKSENWEKGIKVLISTLQKLNTGTDLDSYISKQKDVWKVLKARTMQHIFGITTLRELTEVEKMQLKFGDDLTEQQLTYAQAIDEANAVLKEQQMIMQGLQEIASMFNEIASMAEAAANRRISAIDEVMNREIENLKKTRKFQKFSAFRQAKEEEKIREKAEKDKDKARKKANKLKELAFRAEQASNIGKAIMNTANAVTAASPPALMWMIPMIKAIGVAQVALILAQKPPKMEQGGMVGGRRHSQGGTMIEAEEGEFVVSREGVESVGIETLNRINQGGGSGNINIVFEGNVLSEDFIVDEAIPKIKEALRRGEDIGLS